MLLWKRMFLHFVPNVTSSVHVFVMFPLPTHCMFLWHVGLFFGWGGGGEEVDEDDNIYATNDTMSWTLRCSQECWASSIWHPVLYIWCEGALARATSLTTWLVWLIWLFSEEIPVLSEPCRYFIYCLSSTGKQVKHLGIINYNDIIL